MANSLSDRDAGVGAGQGIIGMTERATVARGTVTSSRKGDQWLLEAYLPEPDHLESEHPEADDSEDDQ